MANSGVILLEKSPSPPAPLSDWRTINENDQMVKKSPNGTNAEDAFKNEFNESNNLQTTAAASVENLKKMIEEREDMWKEHARRQILFLQDEHSRTLSGLHQEIQRLQHKCFDAEKMVVDFQSNMDTDQKAVHDESELLKALNHQVLEAHKEIERLKNQLYQKDAALISLRMYASETEKRLCDDLRAKSAEIKRLTAETIRQTAALAQSSAQINHLKMQHELDREKLHEMTTERDRSSQNNRHHTAVIVSTAAGSGSAVPSNVKSAKFPPYRISVTVPSLSCAQPIKKCGLEASRAQSSLLPPIGVQSPNALIAAAINIEKPACLIRPATITTKATFRASLKRNSQSSSSSKGE